MFDKIISKNSKLLSDWECYLLPAQFLQNYDHLPIFENCRSQLEHIVIPREEAATERINHELTARNVCAVSWRWSQPLPSRETFNTLDKWSPLSDLQFERLLEKATQTKSDFLWIDWSCVPQFSEDTMKFINSSYDIYSQSPKIIFLPRLKQLKRREWLTLSGEKANEILAIVETTVANIISTGKFSDVFRSIARDPERIERLETRLRNSGYEKNALNKQVKSITDMLYLLFTGNMSVYPTFDYYSRAWTLAERLAIFNPSRTAPIKLGDMHSAGDALLYGMSSYWRDVYRHSDAYSDSARAAVKETDIKLAVYVRGVEYSNEDISETWDDMNQMVQLAPGILGIASETAALAVICAEWLLHKKIGASDNVGRIAASLLGECAAYASLCLESATLLEAADREWFRKYLHFQAGGVYDSTIPKDLILAVYRSCGIEERATEEEAINACLTEAFGDSEVGYQDASDNPSIDKLLREAVRHDELHTYMLSRGNGADNLKVSDFSPMISGASQPKEMSIKNWHDWLAKSGLLVSWWFSRLDQAMPVDPEGFIDVEQIYCGDLSKIKGLTLDEILNSCVSVAYKINRLDDWRWQLVQISLSRSAGKSGEGLSPYRVNHNLTFDNLLGPGVIRNGYADLTLMNEWNGRFLNSLDVSIHNHWLQCVSSNDIRIVS